MLDFWRPSRVSTVHPSLMNLWSSSSCLARLQSPRKAVTRVLKALTWLRVKGRSGRVQGTGGSSLCLTRSSSNHAS
ncbi:hypothetical protein LINPERHAP1_LOCUS14023 [Linum perenne]